MKPGQYTVEKPVRNGWALVMMGTLAQCYEWIRFANYRKRHQQTYRILDPDGNVVPAGPLAKEANA